MKKTLIALAAVAVSSAAFAQVSGVLDFAPMVTTNIKTAPGTGTNITDTTATVKTSATAAQNQWTTAQIVISGTEELEGGLKASFTVNTGIGATSSFADRDTNVSLAGGFGTVRVGRFVPAAAMGYHALSGAATTSQGSIYGIGLPSANIVPNGAARGPATVAARDQFMSGGSFERGNNRIQYTSPNLMGVVANLDYSANSSDDDRTALTGKAETTQTGFSLNYANGPIAAGFGSSNRTVTSEAAAGSAGSCIASATVAAATATETCGADGDPAGVRLTGANPVGENKAKAALQWFGASYDLGVARISVAQVNRKDETTVAAAGTAAINADISVTSFGVSVPMGKITLAASAYQGTNKNTAATDDDMKLSGNQISARYAMSKRTTAYAFMGTNDVKRDGATNTNSPTRKATTTAVGLMHSF